MSTVTTHWQKALTVCLTMEYAVDKIMTFARFCAGRERMTALMPSLAFSTKTTSAGVQQVYEARAVREEERSCLCLSLSRARACAALCVCARACLTLLVPA